MGDVPVELSGVVKLVLGEREVSRQVDLVDDEKGRTRADESALLLLRLQEVSKGVGGRCILG